MNPEISIVMPCFQQAAFVEEAVLSVLEQRDVEAELIVLDPGSTDGSRERVQALAKRFGSRLVTVFEPDAGQSDAVNRGLARARAPLLGWLNSDDRLRPGGLRTVVGVLQGHAEPMWLYGSAGMVDGEGREISRWIVRYKNWRGRRFSRVKLLTENFIAQMAVFWNRPLWERVGVLDVTKHLDMDYDLWFRFARVADPLVLAEVLADFRVHAAAKGSTQTAAQLAAAWATARSHAEELGWRGRWALGVHRLLAWRTQFAYRWLKP